MTISQPQKHHDPCVCAFSPLQPVYFPALAVGYMNPAVVAALLWCFSALAASFALFISTVLSMYVFLSLISSTDCCFCCSSFCSSAWSNQILRGGRTEVKSTNISYMIVQMTFLQASLANVYFILEFCFQLNLIFITPDHKNSYLKAVYNVR